MKTEHSWTRQQYAKTYALFRYGLDVEFVARRNGIPQEIVKAADYSYQAKDYDVHGWSSDTRLAKFLDMQSPNIDLDGLPF